MPARVPCHDGRVTERNSFVGREQTVGQLDDLLGEERLVTLVGAGGIGKTRLASTMAARRVAAGEVALVVELAPAGEDDELDVLIARELGGASIDTFAAGLDGEPALVVLDNCEHVVAGAAVAAEQLLDFPNLSVLATSRTPLGAAGEYVVTLGPLRSSSSSGDDASPAFDLFLERARSAGASWLDEPGQRAAAAEIVRRLDGVPLAIELAAARSRSIGPTDLVSMLPSRLDLLDAGPAGAPARGMRAAVAASYEPLDDDSRQAFRALSLVAQGVDLRFATALVGDGDPVVALDRLGHLIDQSLVYTVVGPTGDLVYRLLEPVRAFGLEQLGMEDESATVADRYVDAVCAFAHEVVVATATSFSGDLVDEIAQRYVHLLNAIEFTLQIDDTPARAYRLLMPFYAPTKAPRREQARLAARVRDRWPDDADPFRAAAYAIMGHVALWAGGDDPTVYAREALADPGGTRIARIIALRVLAFSASQDGDRSQARAHIEAALEIASTRGGSFERELKMSWASLVDDPDLVADAIATAEEMATLASESGEIVPVVWAATICVHHQLRLGQLTAARVAAERALDFADRASSPWPTASAHRALAFVCTAEGRWDDAVEHFRVALESVVASGDVEGITYTVRAAATCAHHSDVGSPGRLWLAVPTRYRPPSVPPLFPEAEAELLDRYGEPVPVPVGDAIRTIRAVLHAAPRAVPSADAPEPGDDARPLYRFDDYELDPGRRELRHGGSPVHVEPQVFDVLLRLVEDAGVLVSKEQLMDDVWGSRFVSASALTSRIKSARAATGDDGKAQRVIRTVHGRGFMFVAELEGRPAVLEADRPS